MGTLQPQASFQTPVPACTVTSSARIRTSKYLTWASHRSRTSRWRSRLWSRAISRRKRRARFTTDGELGPTNKVNWNRNYKEENKDLKNSNSMPRISYLNRKETLTAIRGRTQWRGWTIPASENNLHNRRQLWTSISRLIRICRVLGPLRASRRSIIKISRHSWSSLVDSRCSGQIQNRIPETITSSTIPGIPHLKAWTKHCSYSSKPSPKSRS